MRRKIIATLNFLQASRDTWKRLAEEFSFYHACHVQAIETLYEKYDSDERVIQLLDELTSLYDELEKGDGSE